MTTVVGVDSIDSREQVPESRSHWYVLFLLTLGYIVYSLDKVIIAVLIEPIKQEFGLSDTQMSMLAGMAMTIPFALTCIPLGMLADRVNRKRLLVFLMLAWSLLTGMAGLATTVVLLYISRIGVGALESGFSPVSLSILTDKFSKKTRATAMGIFALGAPMGVFAGMALGGFIAGEYGWRAAFFIAGAPGILLALTIAASVKEPKRGHFDEPDHKSIGSENADQLPSFLAVLKNIGSDRALFLVLAGLTLSMVAPAVFSIWTPSFLIRVHGMDIKQAGFAASIVVGVCGAFGAPVGGYFADYLGREKEWRKLISPMIGISLSIVCAALALIVLKDIVWILVALAVATFFAQFLVGTGFSVTAGLAPPSMRSAILSISLVLYNLGSYGFGVLIFGLLSDALEGRFGVMSISYGLIGVLSFCVVGVFVLFFAMNAMKAKLAG